MKNENKNEQIIKKEDDECNLNDFEDWDISAVHSFDTSAVHDFEDWDISAVHSFDTSAVHDFEDWDTSAVHDFSKVDINHIKKLNKKGNIMKNENKNEKIIKNEDDECDFNYFFNNFDISDSHISNKEIINWDVSNVTNMYNLFKNTPSKTDITKDFTTISNDREL